MGETLWTSAQDMVAAQDVVAARELVAAQEADDAQEADASSIMRAKQGTKAAQPVDAGPGPWIRGRVSGWSGDSDAGMRAAPRPMRVRPGLWRTPTPKFD